MTTTPITQVTGPHYYRTFAGYTIPFHPVDPLSFAETEGMRAYNSVYHDTAGRVVRFDKIRLVRLEKEPREVALTAAVEPEVAIYFAVVPGSVAGEVGIGEPLAYEDTDNREEFFAGHAGLTGKNGKVIRFRREIAFTDTYAYWPNGRLRLRVKSGLGNPPTEENFDRYGDPVAERIPFTWEAILHLGVQALNQGDSVTAQAKFEEALTAGIKEQSLQGQAAALNRLARLDLDRAEQAAGKAREDLQTGNPAEAERHFAEADRFSAAVDEKSHLATPLWRALNKLHGDEEGAPTVRLSASKLEALEQQIDECIPLAKGLSRKMLDNAIRSLRRARNEIVSCLEH